MRGRGTRLMELNAPPAMMLPEESSARAETKSSAAVGGVECWVNKAVELGPDYAKRVRGL